MLMPSPQNQIRTQPSLELPLLDTRLSMRRSVGSRWGGESGMETALRRIVIVDDLQRDLYRDRDRDCIEARGPPARGGTT